jgi:hypothetical protein
MKKIEINESHLYALIDNLEKTVFISDNFNSNNNSIVSKINKTDQKIKIATNFTLTCEYLHFF